MYCTGHAGGVAVLCTIKVIRYSHLDSRRFAKVYCWPAACIRRPKLLLDLPSWRFAKVFSPIQYFADSPKFYAANVSRYMVYGIQTHYFLHAQSLSLRKQIKTKLMLCKPLFIVHVRVKVLFKFAVARATVPLPTLLCLESL